MVSTKKIKVFVAMILLKLLYMASVTLLLPDEWLIFDFDKNINWNYLFIEMIPFVIATGVYCHRYRADSDYTFLSTVLFVMAFIPANSVLSLCGYSPAYYVLLNIFFIIIFAIFAALSKKEPRSNTQNTFISEKMYKGGKQIWIIRLVMFVLCGAMILYTYLYNGIDFDIIFSSMYDTRAEYATHISSMEGSFFSYFLLFFNGALYWLLPIYLFYAIANKKILDILLSIFTFFCMYLLEMQKSTLMLMIVIFVIAFLMNKKRRGRFCDFVIIGFISLFSLVLIEYVIWDESLVFNLVIDRMFYIPAYLSEKYYFYFSENAKFWLTRDAFFIEEILGRLFDSGYNHGAVDVISSNVYNGIIPSPNTGLFAEAYLQFGALGTVVFPFIIGCAAKLLRKSAVWYGKGATAVIFARLALSVLNTQLLTSGRVVGIVMFIVITFIMSNFFSRQTVSIET